MRAMLAHMANKNQQKINIYIIIQYKIYRKVNLLTWKINYSELSFCDDKNADENVGWY
jgi:hypothetical protein